MRASIVVIRPADVAIVPPAETVPVPPVVGSGSAVVPGGKKFNVQYFSHTSICSAEEVNQSIE